jgi:hypothetical protein
MKIDPTLASLVREDGGREARQRWVHGTEYRVPRYAVLLRNGLERTTPST